jgi:hypothetical protein
MANEVRHAALILRFRDVVAGVLGLGSSPPSTCCGCRCGLEHHNLSSDAIVGTNVVDLGA